MPVSKLITDDLVSQIRAAGLNPENRCSGKIKGEAMVILGKLMSEDAKSIHLLDSYPHYEATILYYEIKDIVASLDLKFVIFGRGRRITYDIWK